MSDARLRVALADHGYDVVIASDLLTCAEEYIAPLIKNGSAVIITDNNVGSLYAGAIKSALQKASIKNSLITLPAGEQTKSFSMLEGLINQLLDTAPERNTTLIALGGGVIGDITGFAASILLRGVPFIQIPTTLLAQVDSSVGGKTGINTRHGKNLVGSFYQPKLVLVDTNVLSTLPRRELLSGYAEVVKYGLINDAEFFNWLEQHGEKLLSGDPALLSHAIRTSCASKAAIVAEDEKETGQRALLNLGHTFAHALEAETGYSSILLHGEAVAIGMVMAFQLSAHLGLIQNDVVIRIQKHLSSVGLRTSPLDIRPDWSSQKLIAHFYHDKKVQAGKLTFVLARGIGQSFIQQGVNEEDVVTMLATHYHIQ